MDKFGRPIKSPTNVGHEDLNKLDIKLDGRLKEGAEAAFANLMVEIEKELRAKKHNARVYISHNNIHKCIEYGSGINEVYIRLVDGENKYHLEWKGVQLKIVFESFLKQKLQWFVDHTLRRSGNKAIEWNDAFDD